MSLAREKRRANAGTSAGGMPGLRNPIVAREIDKLELGVGESIELIRLRDDLDETLAMIEIKSEKLRRLLRDIAREFGKELPFSLHYGIFRRAGATSILRGWLDGRLSSGVKIVISKEDDGIRAEYIYGDWKITGNVFPPDATIQEVIDWFIHNHNVFENMVDTIGTSTGVHLDEMQFMDWLRKNNIPLDNPYVKKARELFNELSRDVGRFESLIEELQELIGWKKEEEEAPS